MLALLVLLALLVGYWLYRIVETVRAVNARQRFVLTGSSTPPIFPSSRRPAASPSPLGTGQGRAAERLVVRELCKDGTVIVHRFDRRGVLVSQRVVGAVA